VFKLYFKLFRLFIVVALFNAISKSKREVAIKNQPEKSEKVVDVKDNSNADRRNVKSLASVKNSSRGDTTKERGKEWRVFDDELMTSQKGHSTKNKVINFKICFKLF